MTEHFLPKVIRIERKGKRGEIYIDGEQLAPYLSAEHPIIVEMPHDGLATVTVTFVAKSVEAVNLPIFDRDEIKAYADSLDKHSAFEREDDNDL